MTIPEFAFCYEKPVIYEFDGRFMVVFRRCISLTMEIADKNIVISNLVRDVSQQSTDHCSELEWKLPVDPHSRRIEFRGRSIPFSVIRFAMMKLLIEKNNGPVSYSDVSQAAWGHYVDKSIIEKQIYPLNRYLSKMGVDKVVRSSKEQLYLLDSEKLNVSHGKKDSDAPSNTPKRNVGKRN